MPDNLRTRLKRVNKSDVVIFLAIPAIAARLVAPSEVGLWLLAGYEMFAVLIVLIGLLIFLVVRRGRPKPHKDPLDVERTLRHPEIPAEMVFLVASSSDEASGALAAGSMISWLSARVIGALVLGLSKVKDVLPYLNLLFVFIFLLAGIFWVLQHFVPNLDSHLSSTSFHVGRYTLTVVEVVFGSMMSAAWLLAELCWACALPFGTDIGFLPAVLLRITTEETPPGGPWSVLNVQPAENTRGSKSEAWELMHSTPYSAPQSIKAVADWIVSRLSP
jgi:hypothetical protein